MWPILACDAQRPVDTFDLSILDDPDDLFDNDDSAADDDSAQ